MIPEVLKTSIKHNISEGETNTLYLISQQLFN